MYLYVIKWLNFNYCTVGIIVKKLKFLYQRLSTSGTCDLWTMSNSKLVLIQIAWKKIIWLLLNYFHLISCFCPEFRFLFRLVLMVLSQPNGTWKLFLRSWLIEEFLVVYYSWGHLESFPNLWNYLYFQKLQGIPHIFNTFCLRMHATISFGLLLQL